MDEKDVQLQQLRELNAELEDEIEVGARQRHRCACHSLTVQSAR